MRTRPALGATLAIFYLASVTSTTPVQAGRYTRMVIFGDSVTDQGNVWLTTENKDFPPSPPYSEGRFSNGPVWVEYLAPLLDVPVPKASLAGGTNFAYGGARTSFELHPEPTTGVTIPGMGKQVEAFLAQDHPGPHDLFVLEGGYNDFNQGQTDANIPAQNVAQQVRMLAQAGAKHFLLTDLVGVTPLHEQFNGSLSREVRQLRAELPAQIHLVGWYGAVVSMWDSGQFITSGFAYDAKTGVVAPNGEQYACWDEACHFTTRGHEYIADQIYRSTLAAEIGDLNRDESIDALDIDQLASIIRQGLSTRRFDMNDDGLVNFDDHRFWVTDLKHTWFGDATLDGEFNSTDLVAVFQTGQYEDSIEDNSGWASGDWNVDGDFTTSDLVFAFQDGGYEIGPRVGVAAIPEPTSLVLLIVSLGGLLRLREGR